MSILPVRLKSIMLRSIKSRTQDPTPECGPDDSDRLDEWLKLSLNGDLRSRNNMLVWVHRTALEYYLSKVHVEVLLSVSDAWDMASESVVEFERSWHRVRTVAHYCRRMFKNNLSRFLKKKRRLMHREQEMDLSVFDSSTVSLATAHPFFEFERLTDVQENQLRVARRELDFADDIVRCLFDYRVFSGSLTYAEIGEILGTTETSLRMRMTRFNRRVRARYLEQHKNEIRNDRSPVAHALVSATHRATGS